MTEKYINKGNRVVDTKYRRSAPSYRELAVYDGKAREDTMRLAINLEGDCELITGGKTEQKKFCMEMTLIMAEKPDGGHYMPFASVLKKDESAGRLYGMMVACLIAGHFNLKTSYANHGFVPVRSDSDKDKLKFHYQVDPDRTTNEILFYADSPEFEEVATKAGMPLIKMTIGKTTLYIVRLSLEEAARIVGPRKMDGPALIEFLRAQLCIREDVAYYSRTNRKMQFSM